MELRGKVTEDDVVRLQIRYGCALHRMGQARHPKNGSYQLESIPTKVCGKNRGSTSGMQMHREHSKIPREDAGGEFV